MDRNALIRLGKQIVEQGYFNNLVYLHQACDQGKWYFFDDSIWREDIDKQHERTLKQIYRENTSKNPGDPEYIRNCEKLSDSTKWNNLLRIMRTEPEISRVQEDFDQNQNLLNLRNGTLDLSTGEFRKNRADDMLTMQMNVKYDPKAQCPRWLSFLDEVFCGEQEVIDYIQRYIGYGISSSTEEQCFLFLFGEGMNGKSVFTETLITMMGDYGVKSNNMAISEAKGSSAKDRKEQIKADWINKRMVFFCETGMEMRLDEAAIKEMTGNNTLGYRKLYKDFKTFKATQKFILEGNYLPKIKGLDLGMWRRVNIVRFGRTFVAEEIDRDLLSKLEKELDGIFNWVLEGYFKWKANGLGTAPASMLIELKKYHTEMDILGQFIEECLQDSPDSFAETNEMYSAYSQWLAKNGYDLRVSQRKFTEELKKRGYQLDRSNIHKPIFHGIEILSRDSKLET
ncbi:MAG: DUF5906 domain-containing protein [Candidatus Cloacimonetes bacterium]|nr:DUF5906 domain-containing protein [Candidatus Cloacimonadota bacterium]